MRLRRKLGTRRLFRRLPPPGPPGAGPPPPAPEAPLSWRLRCMCGTLVEVGPGDDGKRDTCETCQRRYDIRIMNGAPAGRKSVTLNYIAGKDQPSASATTVVPISAPRRPGAARLALEPEPPNESLVTCRCGALLAVFKSQYEKRGRCPACDARMLVFLLYDAAARTYSLQSFSLNDQSSGKTQLLTKL